MAMEKKIKIKNKQKLVLPAEEVNYKKKQMVWTGEIKTFTLK